MGAQTSLGFAAVGLEVANGGGGGGGGGGKHGKHQRGSHGGGGGGGGGGEFGRIPASRITSLLAEGKLPQLRKKPPSFDPLLPYGVGVMKHTSWWVRVSCVGACVRACVRA